MGTKGEQIISASGLPEAQKRALQRRCQRGELVRLARGMYLSSAVYEGLDFTERRLAQLVAIGRAKPKSVIMGRTAAHVLGLPVSHARDSITTPFELCALGGAGREDGARFRRIGKITYQRAVVVLTKFGPLVVTDVPTTCADLARWHSVEDGLVALEYCLNNARQEDLACSHGSAPRPVLELRDNYAANPTSLRNVDQLPPLTITAKQYEQLRERISRGNVRSSSLRTVLRLATAFSESPAESRTKLAMFRLQQCTQEFPTPLQQVPVHFHAGTQYRLDFYFPQHALAVEYDGQGKHRGEFGVLAEHALREGWDRHTRLTAAGIALFHVGRDADPQWPQQLAGMLRERCRSLEVRVGERAGGVVEYPGSLLRGDVGAGQGVPAWTAS